MKREIKFRAWYEGEYHYNPQKHHIEHHSMSGRCGDVWDFSDWLKYSDVQQYTGLKDKNGKEIYEGDICKNRFGNLEEFWIAELLNVRVRLYSDEIYNRYPNSHDSDYYEIVGNIYQNPELLKQND